MKNFFGLLMLVLMSFLTSSVQASTHPQKHALPDCTVMVCQSVDVTANTAFIIQSDINSMFKITTIEFIKIPGFDLVTQSIEKGYSTQIQLPPNTIISEKRNKRLVPMPFVRYVDNNSRINHYTKTASTTVNLNTCRHV